MNTSGILITYIRENGIVDAYSITSLISNTFDTFPMPRLRYSKVLSDLDPKPTNFNPNDTNDPYGYNKNKYHLRYDHSITDYAANTPSYNGYFDSISTPYFDSIATTSFQWTAPRSVVEGKGRETCKMTSSMLHYYNNGWRGLLPYRYAAYFPVGSGFFYTVIKRQGPGQTDKVTTDLHIHENYGSVTVGTTSTISETVSDKQVSIRVDGSNNINTLKNNNIAAIDTSFLVNGDVNMQVLNKKQIEHTYYDGYHITKFAWDDALFKEKTGVSISESGWLFSGLFKVTLQSLHTGNDIAYDNIYAEHTFTHPTETGIFYYQNTDTILSGYYNDSSISIYNPPNIALQKLLIHYNDGDKETTLDVKDRTSINLDTKDHQLRGKKCQLQAYYDTIASDRKMYSPPIVPTYEGFYDIQDVTLTMSGVREDALGDTNYTLDYLKESNGEIQQNYLSQKFSSIDTVKMIVTMNIKANTTDCDGETRVYTPHPSGIWLIAFPKTGITSGSLRYYINPRNWAVFSDRDTEDEQGKFPKVISTVAKSWVELCTGSPNTLTANGIIWNSISPNNPNAPENGTFTNSDYTIDIHLTQGSWAPFLIISEAGNDEHNNFTGYCLSNVTNYDIPTYGAFTDI